jgi:hypothetical protein
MWTQRAAGSLTRRRVWNGSGNVSRGPDLLRSFRVRRRTVALLMRNQSFVFNREHGLFDQHAPTSARATKGALT